MGTRDRRERERSERERGERERSESEREEREREFSSMRNFQSSSTLALSDQSLDMQLLMDLTIEGSRRMDKVIKRERERQTEREKERRKEREREKQFSSTRNLQGNLN